MDEKNLCARNAAQRALRVVALALGLAAALVPAARAGLIPALGQAEEVQADWSDPAPHPLSFSRHYRSGGNVAAGLGANWSHNWAATLVARPLDATVQFGTGGKGVFTRTATGQPWQSQGGRDRLETHAGGMLLTRSSDESRWLFDASGRLLSVVQRNGWTASLAYDASGRLVQVANAFGRKLAFVYGSAGQLVAVTAAGGQSVQLHHDAQGRHTGAVDAGGGAVAYLYEDSRFPSALTGVIDESGARSVTYGYDEAARATSMQRAGGVGSMTVTYPAGSGTGAVVAGTAVDPGLYRMTVQVTDALGRVETTVWQGGDGKLRMAAASDPAGGGVAARTFDPATLLTSSETDFMGVLTTYQWDAARQLRTGVTRAAGRPEAQAVATQWHPEWRLPLLVSEPGRSTSYTYDAAGNPVTRTVTDVATGQSRTWTTAYGPNGLPSTLTGPLGGVWTFGYDAAGRRTSIEDPLGRSTLLAYDAAGRLASRTEPGGRTTQYTYDARGRVLTERSGDEVTSYEWLPTGRLQSVTLPSGYRVGYAYDSAQRLVGASDNRGAAITYSLDAAGHRVREEVRNADGSLARVTARVVNSLGQVTAELGALGQGSQLAYDANGRPVTSTDPLHHTTRQAYDGLGRSTATTFPDNAAVGQAWNALDQLTQVTDPKGVATTYTYNAFGEVLSETSPDIGTLTYTRDADGRIVSTQDAKGQVTQIGRDPLGRPTSITYADGAQVTFAWDAAGHLEQVRDRSGSTLFGRDAQGRVTSKSQSVDDDAASPAQYSVLYGHVQGRLSTLRYPSGMVVSYQRDATGRITGIQVQHPPAIGEAPKPPVQLVADLTYTALGQPRAWRWHNGAQALRTFDGDGRMAASEFATYAYDAAGRIVGGTQKLLAERLVSQPEGDALELYTATLPWSAAYDNRDRLTGFRIGGSAGAQTQYTYDPNSNRLTAIVHSGTESDLEGQFEQLGLSTLVTQALAVPATSNRLLGLTQTKTTYQDGQVVSQATEQQAYAVDANGSMTHDGQRGFVHDASGRLVEVKLQQGGEEARVKYLHNALGQRVFKSQAMATQAAPRESALGAGFVDWLRSQFGWLFSTASGSAMLGQAFVYGDGEIPSWALLGEYDNGAGLGRTEYLWLPLENGYAVPVGMVRDGAVYAVHPDHLGTPRLVTDPTNRPVWQWPYSAFGQNRPTGVLQTVKHPVTQQEVLKGTPPGAVSNFRFPGQYFDAEAGSFYNLNRDYLQDVGRYMQFDPIGLRGGLNGFGYVGSDPLTFYDPSGLKIHWNGKTKPNAAVIALLERLDECNGDKDIYVTSTVRDERSNAAAGGRRTSRHLTGGAVDFYVPGQSSAETAAQAVAGGAMGVSTCDKHK